MGEEPGSEWRGGWEEANGFGLFAGTVGPPLLGRRRTGRSDACAARPAAAFIGVFPA